MPSAFHIPQKPHTVPQHPTLYLLESTIPSGSLDYYLFEVSVNTGWWCSRFVFIRIIFTWSIAQCLFANSNAVSCVRSCCLNGSAPCSNRNYITLRLIYSIVGSSFIEIPHYSIRSVYPPLSYLFISAPYLNKVSAMRKQILLFSNTFSVSVIRLKQ